MLTLAPLLVGLLPLGGVLADDVPEADDVTAGPWGLIVFLLLVVATVVLMRSFLKQMRKTEAARKAGVFGDVPEDETTEDETSPDGVDDGPGR